LVLPIIILSSRQKNTVWRTTINYTATSSTFYSYVIRVSLAELLLVLSPHSKGFLLTFKSGIKKVSFKCELNWRGEFQSVRFVGFKISFPFSPAVCRNWVNKTFREGNVNLETPHEKFHSNSTIVVVTDHS
jgi:hypothetical protein